MGSGGRDMRQESEVEAGVMDIGRDRGSEVITGLSQMSVR